MDGINPTLAFAALFFGLSGHHATQDQSMNVGMSDEADCPALVINIDSPQPRNLESWTDALQNSLAGADALPGMDDPALEDTAPAKDRSDPIARRMVPVAASGPVADPATDPCAPER